jgi:hypothetical protein
MSLETYRATISSSAVLIYAHPKPHPAGPKEHNRAKRVTLINSTGTDIIYLGPSGVTAATGVRWDSASIELALEPSEEIYGITSVDQAVDVFVNGHGLQGRTALGWVSEGGVPNLEATLTLLDGLLPANSTFQSSPYDLLDPAGTPYVGTFPDAVAHVVSNVAVTLKYDTSDDAVTWTEVDSLATTLSGGNQVADMRKHYAGHQFMRFRVVAGATDATLTLVAGVATFA